jgi:hypothetical protein
MLVSEKILKNTFHINRSRRSEINTGDTQTHRQHCDRISVLFFPKYGKLPKINTVTRLSDYRRGLNW